MDNLLPSLWEAQLFALGSALFFSFSDLSVRRGMVGAQSSAWMAAYVSAGVNSFLFAVALLVSVLQGGMGGSSLDPKAVLWFGASGLAGPFVARSLNYSSIRRVGASRTSPVISSSPLFVALLSAIFLGEKTNLRLWIGTLGIVLGVVIVAQTYRR